MINPYINLLDWLEEEENELDSYIQAITSLNALYSQMQNLVEEKENLDTQIKEINSDSLNYRLKYYFNFKFLKSKTKEEEIMDIEICKNVVSVCLLIVQIDDHLSILHTIIRIASLAMIKSIEQYKKEHIAGYHESLKLMSEVNNVNSKHMSEIWNRVINEDQEDKNINIKSGRYSVRSSKIEDYMKTNMESEGNI